MVVSGVTDLPAGTRLGAFEIEELLASGSAARVYRARQAYLDRPVALKVFEKVRFAPRHHARRFLREATALARLEHPHVVPIYHAGEHGAWVYFATRLMEGGTLADAAGRGVSAWEALAWATDVCDALAFAHERGIVHRDVKPSNVLLDDGEAYLADFGLAFVRDRSRLSEPRHVLGTPLYMSPEQARGEEVGPASDCFSLAVVLLELLCGRHPVFGDAPPPRDLQETLRRIAGMGALPLDRLAGVVPPQTRHLFERALHPESTARYRDASRMLEDLRKVSEAVTIGEARSRIVAVAAESAAAEISASAESDPTLTLDPALLAGRYRLEAVIGEGGQGIVHRAFDTVLGRAVAIKVLHPHLRDDPHTLAAFRSEARTAAGLSHPGIIEIYDYGIAEGTPYIVMPFVDGPGLDVLIRAGRPMSSTLCLEVLRNVAGALRYAHGRGVAHLDVKPANILLLTVPGDDPAAVLTDFTMARWTGRSGQASGFTPAYASPEQLTRLCEPGPASDWFSLGVVLWEMATGRLLFHADPGGLRGAAGSRPVPPPSRLAPGVPAWIDAVVTACLERDAAERAARVEGVMQRGTGGGG
ncbi:MAG TPA: serine/threonine-protein kinase [Candidatus Polarisedimenticolaceae bacterium]